MFENIIVIIVISFCVIAVGRRVYKQLTRKNQGCESASCDCDCSGCASGLSMDKKENQGISDIRDIREDQ